MSGAFFFPQPQSFSTLPTLMALQTANASRRRYTPKGSKASDTLVPQSEKTIPHSIDAEQALLACCILEGGQESVTSCIESKITPEAFYKPAHQIIFECLLELYQEGTPIDEIILGDKLKSKNYLEAIGGYPYINTVTNRIDTPAHLPHYLKQVRDTALLRRLIKMSTYTIEQAYQGQEDISQFLESVEQEVFKISEDRISDSAKPIKDNIEKAVQLVTMLLQRQGVPSGVQSGFTDLDKMTFGFHPQELIIIAGRPSMGKTSLALNIAESAVIPKRGAEAAPTLVFSLEMSADQLAMRLLCCRARVNMSKLRDGFIKDESNERLAEVAKEFRKAPLWIDDTGSLSILELRAKARRMQAQLHGNLKLIIVDYLQLISGTDPRVPREQQIAEISRGLKSMAKELNVPVIVGAQLNRDSEKERRQPRLSDLRESGSIEQDADLVMLISRKKDFDEQEELTAPAVQRDLIVAKQRNGPVGSVPLTYTRNLTRFDNFIPDQFLKNNNNSPSNNTNEL